MFRRHWLAARPAASRVRLRPLTVADLQRISRAAKDNEQLAAALMVHAALEEPALTVPQVQPDDGGAAGVPARSRSTASAAWPSSPVRLEAAAEAPLARAAQLLARRFGWTPQQLGELTLGQILLHLQMLRDEGAGDA